MKIKGLIDPIFIKDLNINENKDYEKKYLNWNELICIDRIDVIAKILYLKSIIYNYHTLFFEEMYKDTIEVFSNGSYREPGNKEKTTFKKYKEIFIKLYEDITKNGFDEKKSIMILGKNNVPLDGGHRLAIAYYNKINVPYIKINDASVSYDLNYFKNNGLKSNYLDYLCLNYSKLKDNIYVMCLWQTLDSNQKKNAINEISITESRCFIKKMEDYQMQETTA